ncbi:MAG: hypothetical protein SGPRY_007602, partial [Prymnesium sp.]
AVLEMENLMAFDKPGGIPIVNFNQGFQNSLSALHEAIQRCPDTPQPYGRAVELTEEIEMVPLPDESQVAATRHRQSSLDIDASGASSRPGRVAQKKKWMGRLVGFARLPVVVWLSWAAGSRCLGSGNSVLSVLGGVLGALVGTIAAVVLSQMIHRVALLDRRPTPPTGAAVDAAASLDNTNVQPSSMEPMRRRVELGLFVLLRGLDAMWGVLSRCICFYYCECIDHNIESATKYREEAATELSGLLNEITEQAEMEQVLKGWSAEPNKKYTRPMVRKQLEALTGIPTTGEQHGMITSMLERIEAVLREPLDGGASAHPPMRPSTDALAEGCAYRPLLMYFLGAFLHSGLAIYLWWKGFKLRKVNGIYCYVRPGKKGVPVMLFHGCGGLIPYILSIAQLNSKVEQDFYLPLLPCFAPYQMLPTLFSQPKHPKPTELHLALRTLLRRRPAIAVANSMGTGVLAALMKVRDEPIVASAILSDPICFNLISGYTMSSMLYKPFTTSGLHQPVTLDNVYGMFFDLLRKTLQRQTTLTDFKDVCSAFMHVLCSSEPTMRVFFQNTFFESWEQYSLRPSQIPCRKVWVQMGQLDTVIDAPTVKAYLQRHKSESCSIDIIVLEEDFHGAICFPGPLLKGLAGKEPLLLKDLQDAARTDPAAGQLVLAYRLPAAREVAEAETPPRICQLLVDDDLTLDLSSRFEDVLWRLPWRLLKRVVLDPKQTAPNTTSCLHTVMWCEMYEIFTLLRNPPAMWRGVKLQEVMRRLKGYRNLVRVLILYCGCPLAKMFLTIPLDSTISTGMVILALAYTLLDDIVDDCNIPDQLKKKLLDDLNALLSTAERQEGFSSAAEIPREVRLRLPLLYHLVRTYAAEYRHWPAAIKAAKELLWSNSRDPPRRSAQSSIQTFVEMATKKSEDKSRDTQRLILETVLGDYNLLTGKKWNVAPNVRNLLEALGPLGQVLNDVMTPESDMENGNPTPAAIFFEQGCLDACVNQTLEYGLQLKREAARLPPATADCTAISICIHLMMHLVAAIALVQAPLGVSQADIHRVSLVGQQSAIRLINAAIKQHAISCGAKFMAVGGAAFM